MNPMLKRENLEQLPAGPAPIKLRLHCYVYGHLVVIGGRNGKPYAFSACHQNFLIGVQLPSGFISKNTDPGGTGPPPSVTTSRTPLVVHSLVVEFWTPV